MTQSKQSNHAVLITGAAQRIGRAAALTLAKRGYDIALHYHHSKTEAQTLAKEIRGLGVRCELFSCDLSKSKAVLTLSASVMKKFPHWDLLVNNASIFTPSRFDRADLDLLDSHWQINFKAPFILMSEFARLHQHGHIINILDTKVVKNKSIYIAYIIAKKALHEATKLAAVSFAPNIRVNAVAPGIILPPPGQGAAYLKKRSAQIPLQLPGDVDYVTQSIEFLIDNPFLTGQVIFADGGEHLV